jgi:hypothetical protein
MGRQSANEASDRARATGTALSPEDQESWVGTHTARKQELRSQLRARYDYLMRGDPPDSPETWDAIDQLLEDLAEARLDRLPETGEEGVAD